MADGTELKADMVCEWNPHAKAAPVTSREGDNFVVRANGTRTCAGGWQFRFPGIKAGKAYRIEITARPDGLECFGERLRCLVFWGDMPADKAGMADAFCYDYLVPKNRENGEVLFSRTLVAPAESGDCLVLRCTQRWAEAGASVWSYPTVRETDAPRVKRTRISIVTGTQERRAKAKIKTVDDNVNFYMSLCEEAAAGKPNLIVLPEIALDWDVEGHAIDKALSATGPEVEKFIAFSKRSGARVVVGMHERDGDAVYNSAVIAGPEKVEGVYRKTHLATCAESNSGVLAGDGLPVFDTPAGRIGCVICMDSSCAETSRMLGLNGAQIVCLPIMGDHRASRFTKGTPVFHEERWKAIMQVRALDNQYCMAVARNTCLGSCIINAKGEFLAYNDGTEDFVSAEVRLDNDYRKWNGGSQQDIIWTQRRPELYGAFVAPEGESVQRQLPEA